MNNFEDFLRVLMRPENPVFISLSITIFVLILIYFVYNYIVFPLNYRHRKELELKQVKLMALFADLDPDPVLRVGENGQIIYSNNASESIPEFSSMPGKNIKELINVPGIDIPGLIKNNLDHVFSTYINDKYYMISIRGNSYLNIGQIYFHDISDTKKYEIKLKNSRRKLRNLTQHLLHLIEEERERISAELHDGIGQNLLFLQMKLQAQSESKEGDPLHQVVHLLDDTVKDLRNIIYDLRPKILQEMGLVPALNYLCGQISSGSNLKGRVNTEGLEDRFEWKRELFIFRIVQELLNNIVRHSHASQFDVQLIRKNKKIRIMVSDDGIGFNFNEVMKSKSSAAKSGYGLINLKERVSFLNGKLKIDSGVNRGTIIIVEIPEGA